MYIRKADNAEIAREVISQFQKKEILEIAGILGVPADRQERVQVVLDRIFDSFAEYGISDLEQLAEDDADLMLQFLVVAEILNSDGEQIDYMEQADNLDDIEKPECYGSGDERDVACKRCRLILMCIEHRMANRPDCFSLHFDGSNMDCKICLEAVPCSKSSIA